MNHHLTLAVNFTDRMSTMIQFTGFFSLFFYFRLSSLWYLFINYLFYWITHNLFKGKLHFWVLKDNFILLWFLKGRINNSLLKFFSTFKLKLNIEKIKYFYAVAVLKRGKACLYLKIIYKGRVKGKECKK